MSLQKELNPRSNNPEGFENSTGLPENLPENLKDLYESWGIVNLLESTLSKLPPDWLRILNISRKLLSGKPAKGVQIPDSLVALTQRDMELLFEQRLVTKKGVKKSELPSEDKDVREIESPAEIAKTLPPYLLLEDLDADLLDYKALTRGLPVLDFTKPQIVIEETSENLEELVPKAEKGTRSRQQVYVLLDISHSMDDNYKLIFAKAVVLAYLIKAQEEGSTVYYRSFYGQPGPLSMAHDHASFQPLAERVLKIDLQGGTDINDALKRAVNDVKELDDVPEGKNADTEILIITDAESFTDIPKVPSNIKLHTLHMYGGQEGRHEGLEDYPKKLTALKRQSATFSQIFTGNLELDDYDEEKWDLLKEAEYLEDELKGNHPSGSAETKDDLRERVAKATEMTAVYEKMSKDKDLKDAMKKLKKLMKNLSKLLERRSKKLEKGGQRKVRTPDLKSAIDSLKGGVMHQSGDLPLGSTTSGFEFRIKEEQTQVNQ